MHFFELAHHASHAGPPAAAFGFGFGRVAVAFAGPPAAAFGFGFGRVAVAGVGVPHHAHPPHLARLVHFFVIAHHASHGGDGSGDTVDSSH